MRERIDRIKNAAEGHWPEIFASVGMDAALFQRQNRPCPLCGGRDRFSFFAKEVGGRWYCRGCGMGDGIKLVQQFTKKEFVQTLDHLETLLGLPVPKGKQGVMKDQQLLDTSFGQKNKGLNSQLCGRKRFLSARSIGRRLFGGIYAPADWAI